MKTRIIYTKFWEDEFILSLTPKEKCLYSFYLTNSNVGLTGIYEIAKHLVSVFTGLTANEIEVANQKFMKANKILFHDSWVKIVNAEKYQQFTGTLNEKAKEKEMELIPNTVLEELDTLYMEYEGVSTIVDTLNNQKSEIINQNKGVVKGKIEISDEEIQEIVTKYDVPVSFVLSKLDDLTNWVSEKPARARGRDLRKTLVVWVKKDALSIRKEVHDKSKLTVIS